MTKPQKPKFRIGETIVIGFLGTVGKVTGIKRLEGKILYEVNNREGLFQEDALFYIEEFEGNITKYEKVEIAYKFMIGDIVKVRGFKHDLFKVIGYRTEIWRYYQDGWEETVYELYRIKRC
ncbi:hypothetical protein [Bacillus coahuilensis]|uniref:hypothetical protein n=1 Tax=Bacillus coahuilensis TaxID=408580 RepID=UPI0001850C33|nr:hypothetical protein [Bacillus coahuilensis]